MELSNGSRWELPVKELEPDDLRALADRIEMRRLSDDT